VRFNLEAHADPVALLLEKCRSEGMQLADACVVRVSELKRDCRVSTLDRQDFQGARRFEPRVIPLVASE